MKLNQLILPALALSTGALFLISSAPESEAWSTLGTNLSQAQRDFRVYNNFTGATDNNNQTPDANFPGYQGAVMAIWKGSVEWGSTLHGNGNGDPHQVGGLGSGLANFDPSFQGTAGQVGGTNANIHSQISGSNGGVFAYAEGPATDGWRIRYYEGWVWSDGPGSPSGNQADLQGIATHEYGHAIGLGHSNAGNSTMYYATVNGYTARSINNDDRNGLASIYGTASATKPTITGFNISGNQITVSGNNFSATNNEVWFTKASATGAGTPIKVTGLTSNGSSITATIPNDAGPGDILVRKNSTAHSGLSNAWPADITPGGSCTVPMNYCTSNANSGTAAGGDILAVNEPSISGNNFELAAFNLPLNKVGLFFYGPNQTNSAFGDGRLCIGGSITRLSPQVTTGFGFADEDIDFTQAPFNSGNGAAISGNTMNFQFWFRDPGFGVAGFNTTDAVAVTFCD
jgi:hypothetical protein